MKQTLQIPKFRFPINCVFSRGCWGDPKQPHSEAACESTDSTLSLRPTYYTSHARCTCSGGLYWTRRWLRVLLYFPTYILTHSRATHSHKGAHGLAHLLAPHTPTHRLSDCLSWYHPALRRTVASLCNGTSSQPLSWHGGETMDSHLDFAGLGCLES